MSVADLSVHTTPIPGLLVIDLPVHGDNRGWFKENWQRQKMIDLGLPDFGPVQNNVSYNEKAGAARGIHAEPWDKFVSVATGRIFGAWVDLREGPSFGTVFTVEMGPDKAVFVPRGVGNAFQTLVPHTAYSYLVNDHWSVESKDSYSFVNLADPALAIPWPYRLDDAELSDADRNHPLLADVEPVPSKKTLILGATGQVGRALTKLMPNADCAGRDLVDLLHPETLDQINWSDYDTVVNAAAYTAVDEAETTLGGREAWVINVSAVVRLAEASRRSGITLVHISSDYVFDGDREEHTEEELPRPLNTYGQSKAAADAVVSTLKDHYIIRTSWVVGDGRNFVRTMAGLAEKGVKPRVIDDQFGRLTFADTLAKAIVHLLAVRPPSGTYNVTSGGRPKSWADIAEIIYTRLGRSSQLISRVSAQEYSVGKLVADRPRHSTLNLKKIIDTGFTPANDEILLTDYLDRITAR